MRQFLAYAVKFDEWITLSFLILLLIHPTRSLGKDEAMFLNEPIQPLPTDLNLDKAMVELGKKLFEEPRLSHDNTISCSSCHAIEKGGSDHLPRPIGINHAVGPIKTPTVLNSAFNFKQFWDGRAASLEEQVDGPVQNPIEMGSNWNEVLQKLKDARDKSYSELFLASYSDGIQVPNVKNALATYERSLVTSNSPFDDYLRGHLNAISPAAKLGYQKFKNYGCASCHQGVNVGGNMFQKLGAMRDYFSERRAPLSKADLGRFNVTQKLEDKYFFKVPTLRNIAQNPPYFHDASATTLGEAVRVMARFQLGRDLPKEDEELIIEFLKTLTGTPGPITGAGP